jgi:hypothetical protein
MQCFHTDSHCAQCCVEFTWAGAMVSAVNKFFHFALKRYFILKIVRCFWSTLYEPYPYVSNTYEIVLIGHPHSNPQVSQCKTQMHTLQH